MNLSRRQTAVLLVVILLGYILRLYKLEGQSLWWDEIFSYTITTLPPGDMLAGLVADRVHPPLYYFLLDGWTQPGGGSFWLRYLSLLFGVLTLPVLYRLGRAFGGHMAGLTAAFLLAVSPFHIWYSQETRMHTLAVLAVTAAQWFLWRGLHRPGKRDWIIFTICQLTAVYAHYFAWLVVLAQYAFLSLAYRQFPGAFRKWLLSTAVVAAGFSPWGIAILAGGGFSQTALSWIAPAHWFEPILTLLAFSAGPTIDPAQPGWWLAAAVFPVALLVSWRRSPKLDRRFLAVWLLLPLLLTFLISLDLPISQKRSIYMDRNLIVILPGLLLLVSLGLVRWRRWLPYFLLVVTAVNLTALWLQFHDAQFQREGWRQAVTAVTRNWQPGDRLVLTLSDLLPIWFYGGYDLPNLPVDFGDEEEEIAARMTAVSGDRVWLLLVTNNVNPHGFPQERNQTVIEKLTTNNYHRWLSDHGAALQELAFPGITVSLFQVN